MALFYVWAVTANVDGGKFYWISERQSWSRNMEPATGYDSCQEATAAAVVAAALWPCWIGKIDAERVVLSTLEMTLAFRGKKKLFGQK